MIAFLAVHQGLAAVSDCSWNSWMPDLVPEGEQGRFFGRRTAAATALATVLAARWRIRRALEDLRPGEPGDRVFAVVRGERGHWPLWRLSVEHHAGSTNATGGEACASAASHLGPVPRRQFSPPCDLPGVVELRRHLAAPFFAVYMLKTLGYPMTTITALTTASQLSNLAALWAVRPVDRSQQQQGGLAVCALEARRSMHSLSTAAGLLRIGRAAFSFARVAASRERPEKRC